MSNLVLHCFADLSVQIYEDMVCGRLFNVLGFNNKSTLVGLSSPTEKGRKETELVEEMKKRNRGERKMNDSEKTEEIKTFLLYP